MTPRHGRTWALALIVSLAAAPLAFADADDGAIKPVKLAVDVQHKLGLTTQPLAPARRAGAIDGYVRVLDPGPLAQLQSDLEVAQAAADASAAEAKRTRALNAGDQAVPTKAVEAADAQAASDASKLALLKRRLSLEWGSDVARMTDAQRQALLAEIGAAKAALARIDAASGQGLTGLHAADLDLGPLGSVHAVILGAARAADPHLMSPGLLAKVSGPGVGALSVGLSVPVKLAVSGPVRGVMAPRSALVRSQGQTWVYVRTGADSFIREAVRGGRPDPDGLFVPAGLKAGDPVVVKGAAALFSAETNVSDNGDD
ncbi:MAG TPA: hypothetical protein VMU59_06105 [Caulobacteraceae bacterium]|nr:hypothetical protein [Caulobacteraceae bacterium]